MAKDIYSDTSYRSREYIETLHRYTEVPYDPDLMSNLMGSYEMDNEEDDDKKYLARQEMLYKLHCAIKKLTAKQQKIVKLFLAGKSTNEIAEAMGIHQTTVSLSWYGSSYVGCRGERYGGILRKLKILVGEMNKIPGNTTNITIEKVAEIKELLKSNTVSEVAAKMKISPSTVNKYKYTKTCKRGHSLAVYGSKQFIKKNNKEVVICKECKRINQINNRAKKKEKIPLPTQCKQGHPYPENLAYSEGKIRVKRYCKECNRINGIKQRRKDGKDQNK